MPLLGLKAIGRSIIRTLLQIYKQWSSFSVHGLHKLCFASQPHIPQYSPSFAAWDSAAAVPQITRRAQSPEAWRRQQSATTCNRRCMPRWEKWHSQQVTTPTWFQLPEKHTDQDLFADFTLCGILMRYLVPQAYGSRYETATRRWENEKSPALK